MNNAFRSDDKALSESAARRADEVCDRFERAWIAGQRPRIEVYLVDAPAPEYAALLRELLALELTYRRSEGESPSLEEYRQRFPGHAELVAQVFGEAGASVGLDAGEADSSRSSVSTGREPVATLEADQPVRLGRYRITGTLGKGAFGVVYQGYDDDLQRVVAIKVPHRQRVSETGDVEAYLDEARMLASLDHPHIVPVHDFGHTDDGLCYVVSKFIEGSDLKKRIRETRLSVTESAGLVATVAEALHHAHRRGLVHRDIKPSNILIDTTGKAHVADFGLASKEEDFGKGLTIAGTPAYMSPEQARGEGHRLDGRSDIFSLGVVFYELLTGRHPFLSRSRIKLLEQIATVEPRPPRQVDDTIPGELERICLKALAKRASDRYTTAQDMAQDLQHWLAGYQSQASHPVPVGSQPPVNIQVLPPSALSTPGSGAPAIAPSTPSSDQYAIQIVPKGLRSFDASDADFFLELLPGPRDRDRLPDSIRFWKSKIEEPDPDNTFAVGLLYGPSGCGKSSLVKAGLLPRLSGEVMAVYIEATGEETEGRLLHGLRKRCPALPVHLGLKETSAALRRGQGIPVGKKLLIVLDQFEQWLHAKKEKENTELVQALRQCDGSRVQCIVMVRDDFWMGATRFMRELEIRLLEGHNSASVDLFPVRHAEKVLAAFGRAFGALPEGPSKVSKEQKHFLEQAVHGLTREGKIICVRLALLAEMMKGRPWTPASLKQVGGTEGVGVTFLEETFSAATAPPEHRYHQKAARAVLKTLLPESGTDIRGHLRSYAELLEASGYASRPREFDDLIHILDREIRLITPSDPEGSEETDEARSQVQAGQRYYQLTHDYLVPSLRAWLTRKQKETRRGRAELLLADRASVWNARPENRQLPSVPQWLSIRLLTQKKNWTEPQRKMMRRANRYYAIRAAIVAALLLGVTIGSLNLYRQNVSYASSLVDRLIDAEIENVPKIVDELGGYRGWVNPKLIEIANAPWSSEKAKLHAKLALLPVDPKHAEYLGERLLDAGPIEVRVLRDALQPHKNALIDRLWAVVEHPEKGIEGQRLRAACALAIYDPDNSRWDKASGPVATDLVGVPSVFVAGWMEALRPVRAQLRDPLSAIFRDAKRREKERSAATDILADYAADQPGVLAELILDADAQQYAVLLPKLRAHREYAITFLEKKLKEHLSPDWKDPPLNPAWADPDPSLVRQIEAAHGMLDKRFALCQTMPLEEFLAAAEGLRASGYRPTRFRPYATDKNVLVAAVWTRDGQEWQMAHGLPKEDVQRQDDKHGAQSFHPVDVTGYFVDGNERYAALWVKSPAETLPTKMRVGLDPQQVPAEDTSLQKEGYWRATTTWLVTTNGREQYSAIWRKPAGQVPVYESMHMVNPFGENHLADLQVDVQISRAAPSRSTKERCAEQLALAEKALQSNPADPNARWQRAMARADLGENEKANEDLSRLIQKFNGYWPLLYMCRAIIHARLAKAKEAKDDLVKFQELHRDFSRKAYVEAVVSAHLGDEAEGMKRLEAAIDSNAEQARFLYQAACAYSVASGVCAGKDGKNAERFADRAVDLLEKAVDGGYCSPELLDADLDPLRGHAGFRSLLQAGKLERNYIAIWHPRADVKSTQVHGHDPIAHLARCKKLVADGFRPVSISAAEIRAKQPLVTASVWHRPVVPDGDKEHLAKRQVNAAVALLMMGRPEKVWPLLKHKPDPRVRSYLIHRLSSLAANPQAIVKRLEMEQEVSARRALLLCLGEFGEKEPPQVERAALLEKMLDWYRNDPDSGIHGSAGWLLRQWGQMGKLQQIDKELASGKVEGQRRWYVNRQLQTFAVLRGDDFLMGSPRTEAGREDGEQDRREPLHKRRIGRTFAIATHEVTVEQFLRLFPKHGYAKQYAPTPNCPVNGISWYEAAEYCNWLSKKEGLPETEWCYEPNPQGQYADGMKLKANYLSLTGYRLPTEAEWEYACRAGSSTSRYYGETEELLGKYAWCTKNSETCSRPVGSLKPNDWGLFDMLGNNGEWTQDLLYDYYYYPPIFGRGDKLSDDQEHSEPGLQRIFRGGSFSTAPFGVRSATRFNSPPMSHGHAIGFRLARTFH